MHPNEKVLRGADEGADAGRPADVLARRTPDVTSEKCNEGTFFGQAWVAAPSAPRRVAPPDPTQAPPACRANGRTGYSL
ncbi:MAG: hypothetical protein H0U16_04400 [Actinobacteria bacterium]|nr:hypothetical protein [Actinomycetota bacterium]